MIILLHHTSPCYFSKIHCHFVFHVPLGQPFEAFFPSVFLFLPSLWEKNVIVPQRQLEDKAFSALIFLNCCRKTVKNHWPKGKTVHNNEKQEEVNITQLGQGICRNKMKQAQDPWQATVLGKMAQDDDVHKSVWFQQSDYISTSL